jgi:hypothetical protein
VFAFCRAARPQDGLPLPPRVSANINTRECSKSPRVIGAPARICARFFERGAVPAFAPRSTGAEACAEATAASCVNTNLQSLHARLYLQGLVFSRSRRTHPDALRARPIVFASLDRILQNNRFCCFREPLCHGCKIGQPMYDRILCGVLRTTLSHIHDPSNLVRIPSSASRRVRSSISFCVSSILSCFMAAVRALAAFCRCRSRSA